MATVKFSDEMPKPTSIKGTDRFLISDGVTGEAKAPDFNQAKEYLNITGIEMEPLVGGTTSGTALVVPNGPAGEQRTAEVSSGKWYDFGSGPVEASADRRWKSYWNGTSWVLKDMGELPTPTGTNVVVEGGELVVNQDGVFQSVKVVDEKIENVASFAPAIDTVFNGGTGTTMYDTGTFSGWATNYGVLGSFNILRIHHKDLSSIIKATKLKLRICENDRFGTELLPEIEVDINFTNGQIGFIEIILPTTIKNPNNANIWAEFWANGNMALIKTSTSYPSRKLRYKTTALSYNANYAVESQETSIFFTEIPDVQFLHSYDKPTVKDEFSSSILNREAKGELELGDKRAPKAEDVKLAITPFEDVIEPDFTPETTKVISGSDVIQSASTFAGWGQEIGVERDFNAIQYDLLAYDSANKPTYIDMRIRDTNNTGAILFNVRVNVSPVHNVRETVTFVLPEVFTNPDDKSLFVQFNGDGYFASIGSATGSVNGSVKYTTTKGASTVTSAVSGAQTLGMKLVMGDYKGALKSEVVDQLRTEILGESKDPELLLTSKVWLYPSFEYNIFNKNICVPKLGYNGDGYFLDYSGTQGKQFERGYRLSNIPASLNATINLTMSKDRKTVVSKSHTLISGAVNNGNGITRKVLIISDSTAVPNTSGQGKISKPLYDTFVPDVMNLEMLGTKGVSPYKCEATGGKKLEQLVTPGTITYVINVTALPNAPGMGAVYSQGGKNYSITEINVTGGNGYLRMVQTSGTSGAPTASGTLTKVSGTGDATITYASSSTSPANEFYNPATSGFDFGYYLTNTGQSMTSGDWVIIQIGINDVFGLTTISAAQAKANQLLGWMNQVVSNIKSYNSGIRIAISIIPPPSDQNGFGKDYNLDQNCETYRKTGLLEWQKALIATYDNSASNDSDIYLVSNHHNVDCKYNYPMQEVVPNARYTGSQREIKLDNGVHTNADGDYQMSDMYAGLIKFKG